MNIIIDPEFEGLLRPLTDQEFLQLECSVLDDGLLNPLVVWVPQNILLDGHHRLRICRKHNLPFGTMPLGFDSREQALQWVRTNQEGRRNLTPEEIAYVRGQQYGAQKAETSNPDGRNQHGLEVGGHSDHQPQDTTAERLAKKHDISPRTVRRDAQFAEALDSLAEILGDAFRSDVLAGTSGLTKKDVIALSEMSRVEVLAVADDRKAMKALTKDWRDRVDESEDEPEEDTEIEEDAAPEREPLAESPSTHACATDTGTDEAEQLRAIVATYREAMENIVQVCETEEVSVEGLRQLLDDIEALAEEALALEVEGAESEASQ